MPGRLQLVSARVLTLMTRPHQTRREVRTITSPALITSARVKQKPIILDGVPRWLETETEGELLSIWLPIRLTNNNGGRSGHYGKSHSWRRKFELQFRAWNLERTPFDQPVIVEVTRLMSQHERPWDSSSPLRGNWKEIEDALVAVGWFVDDAPKWITQTVPLQEKASGGALWPGIRITIREAGGR